MSMPDHTDDPVAAAGGKVASYLSLATVAAEAIAQLAATRARERAVTDERTAAALRAQRQAAYSQARLGWAPILDPKLRERTGVEDAGPLPQLRVQDRRPAEARLGVGGLALRPQRGGGAFVGGGAFPGPGRRGDRPARGGHRGQAQVGGDLPAGGRDRVVVVVGHAHSPLRPSRGCATGAAGAGERSVGPHPPLPAGGSPAGSSSAHHPSGAGTVGSGGPALCRSTVHCANGPPLPTVPAPEGWWAE